MTSFSLWPHSLLSWPRPPLRTYVTARTPTLRTPTAFNIWRFRKCSRSRGVQASARTLRYVTWGEMTSQQSVIAMLWRNTAYSVKLSDEDSSRYSNKIESDVTITIISQSLPHIMAANSWHRYGVKKLRHCHPTYLAFRVVEKSLRKYVSRFVWSLVICSRQRWTLSGTSRQGQQGNVIYHRGPQWLRAQHFLSK